MNGMPLSESGAPGAVTSSAGAKTCVFEVAATEIASGAVPGEPVEPSPKSSRSFPRGDHGDNTGSNGSVYCLYERIVRRIDLRSAARKVDYVHAVCNCGLEESQ